MTAARRFPPPWSIDVAAAHHSWHLETLRNGGISPYTHIRTAEDITVDLSTKARLPDCHLPRRG
jgi:hypothetical protein